MTTTTPFADAAQAYLNAGWGGVLPLPERRKANPPEGYTGRAGRWPSVEQVEQWAREHPHGNIALRMPTDVIGVDIDVHKDAGVRERLEAITGPLPPTWCSTSRVDGSGIRFYRVPPPPTGKRWVNIPTPAVEIIQHHHRYAVVWPSIHPDTGGTYLWVDEASGELADGPPRWDDLTELPWRAVETLLVEDDTGDVRASTTFTLPAGDMTPAVQRRLDDGLQACRNQPGSRHDTVRDLVLALVRLGERGDTGVQRALDELGEAFVAAVAADRPGGERAARREYADLVEGAERLVAGTVGRIPTRDERLAERPAWEVQPPTNSVENPASAPDEPVRPPLEIRWVHELGDAMPPEPPVLVDGLIRQGELAVLGAPRAIGKSWIAMNLATVLARGEGKLFGHLEVKRAARVLLLQGELDEWGSATRWLRLTGRALPPVAESFDRRIRVRTTRRRTTSTYDGTTYTDEHIDAVLSPLLEEAIVAHGIEVVILDPWATYFAGNENSNDEVEAALDKLRGLTLAHGVSWVIFHHLSKATEYREPEDAWRGASRLADWASTRITVLPHYTARQADEKGMERHVARRFVDAYVLRRSEPTPDFSMHLGADGWWRRWVPDDAEEHLERHGGTTDAGGRPPARSLREYLNQLLLDGGEWASVTAAAERLQITRRAAEYLTEHAVKVELVTLEPGERRAKRIVVTELGKQKGDRFVGGIESRDPVARAQIHQTKGESHLPWSEGKNVIHQTSDSPNPCATEKPQVRASRADSPNPLLRRGPGPDGPPPDGGAETTSDPDIDPTWKELGL